MSRQRIEMHFRIYPETGDEWDVIAQTRDIYVWEKTTQGASISQLSGDGASIMAWYKIAHLAAVREQLTQESLNDFVKRNDITLIEDEAVEDDDGGGDELDPTQRARSATS